MQWQNVKEQTMFYRKLGEKQKIKQHESHKNREKTQVHRKSQQFLLHWWYASCYCVTLVNNPMISHE